MITDKQTFTSMQPVNEGSYTASHGIPISLFTLYVRTAAQILKQPIIFMEKHRFTQQHVQMLRIVKSLAAVLHAGGHVQAACTETAQALIIAGASAKNGKHR